MSYLDAVGRIAEIQTLARPSPPPAESQPAAAGTSFASVLAGTLAPTAPAAAPAPEAEAYTGLIQTAAARYGVDPALITAVIENESGFDPTSTSSAGAAGLMQLMPGTAAGLGVSNPYDPAQSIDGGARYLRAQLDRFGGDVRRAVAAYNAGPGAVERYGGVPPYAETQRYVERVLTDYQTYAAGSAAFTRGG